MHISSVIKISFCRISFSGHQNKFCACLDSIYRSRVILVMCKNCSDTSWHRLNLNQSKTNCPKNLNSDGLIVREMGPWPECIFRSLLQFLVIIIIIIFMMCRFNEYAGFTWFSCHAGFVRLLLDGCYGRWFVYVKQRNATASCWALCAGGTCTLLRTSFVDRNTGRQSIRSGTYPWCSDLSLRGNNMHSMKARFVLLICKVSPGVVTL